MNRFSLVLVVVLMLTAGVACRGGHEGPGAGPNTPAVTGSPAVATAVVSSPTGVAPTPGVTSGELEHGGHRRTYRLFVPEGIPADASVPLLVGLHGGLGSGEQFARNSRFEATAQQHRFIAVFPDGVGRTWNGGNCCGQAAREGIDDVGFLAALIEDLSARLPVDPARVFVTGHSNGGIMAFRFGCERADVVAAVASVAGSLEVPACEPSEGVSLLAIHGDADQNHPIQGGQGPRSIAGVDFVSQARSLELWTGGMGCAGEQAARSSGATTETGWTGCRDDVEARLLVIHGADHPWPGGEGGLPGAQARTSNAIDATEVITAFFLGLPAR